MKLSKLMAALSVGLMAQAASAAVITVIVDDFNGNGTSQAGLFLPFTSPATAGLTAGGVYTPGLAQSLAYLANGSFNFAAGVDVGATGTLSYNLNLGVNNPGVNYTAIGGVAGTGKVVYTVVDSDLANNTINGNSVNVIQSPATQIFADNYASNAIISLVFNGTTTRAWDVAIDSIGVSFECGAPGAAREITLAQLAQLSCRTAVPVPGSLALLGLGGIAAGLISRRRATK
jgi:hypothetical protein